MTAKHPTVSIVIPAYNEESVIKTCIDSILRQTKKAYEIIVVDNRSNDATCQIVRRLQRENPKANIRLLHKNSQQGITPARNHGYNQARGEVIGRIDADSILEPDWVEAVQVAFRDKNIAAVTGAMSYYDMPLRKFGMRGDNKLRKVLSTFQGEYQFLMGSNMAIRRTVWRAIRDTTCRKPHSSKYKDVDDELFEDIDLSIHVTEAGYRTKYVPEMIAGMSARRLRDSTKDFHYYVMRFDRTYSAHKVRRFWVKVPIILYLSVYFPGKALQFWHDRDGTKREVLTLAELEMREAAEATNI